MNHQAAPASANAGWDPWRIRARLHALKITIVSIAKPLGVTPEAVTMVVHNHRRTPYIRQAVADAMGVKVTEVWPECAGWNMEWRRAPKRKAS
ncbi:MAG: helix-turn-helix domain-containing protein [Bacillota bacterium]